MNRYLALVCLLLLSIIVFAIGCNEVQEVAFDQLLSNPDKYNGKQVIIDGFYFGGFEVIVLSESLEYSGYAEGHLVPKGRMVWIEGEIPSEVFNKLYLQQMMGTTERYGKIKVTGKFEYGGIYGHVGAYDSQIVPSQVELLQWSPSKQ